MEEDFTKVPTPRLLKRYRALRDKFYGISYEHPEYSEMYHRKEAMKAELDQREHVKRPNRK